MAKYLVCGLPDAGAVLRFRRLEGFVERLVGLLGTDRLAEPVALCGCSSIHTLGMTYAIDVAFVRRDGHVVLSQNALAPGRVLSAVDAYYVLERPASMDAWPKEGARIELAKSGEAG